MPQNKKDYPLQVGSPGQERLDILNELYNPITQQFLLDSGLKKGMTALEIGCGTGIMACWIAEQIGPKGKVIAIDQSTDQIALAQKNAHAKKLTNIEFLVLSIENINQLLERFDLIFSRWTLCFVTNPTQYLKILDDMLNPQGILAIEDLSVGDLGCFVYPLNNAIDRWMELWKKLFKTTQKDLYFGSSLFGIFSGLGLDALNIHISQPPLITAREKSVAALAAKELREMVISSGNMTPEQIDQLILDLDAMALQKGLLGFLRSILVSGRKLK